MGTTKSVFSWTQFPAETKLFFFREKSYEVVLKGRG